MSPSVRCLARDVSAQDIGHFAGTKHHGLPEHVKAAGKGFFHLMRAAQSGKPLKDVSAEVATAAKRHIPKDCTEVKLADTSSDISYTAEPQSAPPPEVSAKVACHLACLMSKSADIHTIMAKSHQAVHQVGTARRDALAKEVERLRRSNDQLTGKSKEVERKEMDAAKKLHMAEMHAAESDMTLAQMQNVVGAQRNPPPPEQPPYGAMLMGQQPGAAPMPQQ